MVVAPVVVPYFLLRNKILVPAKRTCPAESIKALGLTASCLNPPIILFFIACGTKNKLESSYCNFVIHNSAFQMTFLYLSARVTPFNSYASWYAGISASVILPVPRILTEDDLPVVLLNAPPIAGSSGECWKETHRSAKKNAPSLYLESRVILKSVEKEL